MSGPSLMDSLFQRSLEDIIKGLRQQLIGEQAFISKALDEIRKEIKSTDLSTKSTALLKLSYLSNLHFHDMSFAAFPALEVLSSPRFSHKKIAYHAISFSFHDSTPVLLLITNHLRKDLNSTNEFEVSLSLQCLSRIANVDLARDLTPEVFTLLSSNKLYVRKRAVAVVLRVFEKYPDSVRVCFKRLVENLENSDPQILSSVVGVFSELACKDPRSYLPLAPEFYKILVDSKSNWISIKVLKIFSKLAPLEPRLAKRVVEPVCDLLRNTGAKSLLFECIRTVVTSLSEYESAVRLAVGKVREFLMDDDPNLKYLGLQALRIVAEKHLWAVSENKEVVIKSLSDADPNIKIESLRLVMAMVSEHNVSEISRVLVNYALKSDPVFCNEILGSILSTCSRNLYEIIVDFDWYVSLLGEMSRIPHCQMGEEIENQLIDIGLRVKDVRPELVRVARYLLIDPALLGNSFLHSVLSAAAWASGEYVEFSRNPLELMEALLQPRTSLLPPSIRGIYIQSAFKVLVFCLHTCFVRGGSIVPSASLNNLPAGVSASASYESFDEFSVENGADVTVVHGQTRASAPITKESIVNLLNLVELALGPLLGSHDVEVQERARNLLGIVDLTKPEVLNSSVQEKDDSEGKGVETSQIIKLMHDAFSKELGPVSLSAQGKVSLPDGLVLKENLGDLEMICGDIEPPSSNSFSFGSPYEEKDGLSFSNLQIKEDSEQSNESTSLLAEHRKRHGLYYLPSGKSELISNDYPPANDPTLQCDINDNDDNLVKITAESLVPKRKPNHGKPRPVVVKLNEVDEKPVAMKQPESRDGSLSGAVRDVLFGREDIPPTSSQSNLSNKPSSKRKGKEKQHTDPHLESKENVIDDGNSSSRRKDRSHGKERRHRSPRKKNFEERKDTDQKEKEKSRRHHGRHKSRQRAEEPLKVTAQTPVIPDFLL
ncbi:Adaptor protein 3 delta, delta-adaptin, PROTEIN-AFFECTED TRAFFICKING 4 [Hibiscus trionum]|uniref:AP-3 complex subunit delta n=1 Tax=Hibiscus trionum TaxID=183268 RepID=A0A9W7IMY8_HIBTR|nr:Adaptor protein 3 delta, delta-adaptin, PROTEIN-AFFECTED TRAFFICKING 4 [Hibiscus trionum]